VTANSDVDETSHTSNESAKNKSDTAEHFYNSGTKGGNWKRIKNSGQKNPKVKNLLEELGLARRITFTEITFEAVNPLGNRGLFRLALIKSWFHKRWEIVDLCDY
jgi:hypothetical protein